MTTLFYASYAAMWALLLLVGILVALLYRHFGLMMLGTLEGVQRDGLAVGSLAPTISGVTAAGEDRRWEPKRGVPQLLLFAAPDCEPCGDVLPYVTLLATKADGLLVAAIVPGPQEEVARLVERHHPPFLCLADDASGAFARFQVRVTPFAFVVGGNGRILAKGLCPDVGRLRRLLEAAGQEDAAELLAPTRSQTVDRTVPLVLHGNGRGGAGALEWSER